MAKLTSEYLGLELKNPIIVGACGLGKTVKGVTTCAEAGAGAVVLKSLFEEQIRLEYAETTTALEQELHPEAMGYLEADVAASYGPRWYLDLIRDASKAVDIPVIASVNCTSGETWVEFAQQVAAAGAAALEVNIFILPTDPELSSDALEQTYLQAISQVAGAVDIPVAVKLAPFFTNVGRLSRQAVAEGARGVVLFNRMFHPDIDLEKMAWRGGPGLSHPGDHRRSLRWIAMLAGSLDGDLCAGTGIHDGETVAKQLLAGANAVQVVSALLKNGVKTLGSLAAELRSWMEEAGYEDIDDFRGMLSYAQHDDADLLERAQYIKAFVSID